MNEMKRDWLSKFLPTGWMGPSTSHRSETTESREKADEYEYEYENAQTIESRIIEALVVQQEKEIMNEWKWWNTDESSYQSYEQDQREMQEMDEYVQERGRLLELKLAKLGVANAEKKDMHPNEHKQDEHPKKDYNCKPINSFFMPKRDTENRDVREKELNMTIRNEIQHNKLSREEKAITTAMKRLISKCREQLLVVWKSPTHQLDDNINRF
eukprot:scaffold212386_cov119-Cyclotella_meneghiniana.AAC.1